MEKAGEIFIDVSSAFRNAFFRFNWFFINSGKCNIILMFFRNTFGFFRIWMKTTLSSAWSIFNRTGVKGDQGCSWTNEEPSPFPWGDKSYIQIMKLYLCFARESFSFSREDVFKGRKQQTSNQSISLVHEYYRNICMGGGKGKNDNFAKSM